MIHYHGTPITPNEVLTALHNHHFCVSYYRKDQIVRVAEVASSFMIDNGAFSAWRKGIKVDWEKYKDFIHKWEHHPAYDFHIIPDIIDGTTRENDNLIGKWMDMYNKVPVYHMNEDLARLIDLGTINGHFNKIAIGSSGEYSRIGSRKWWVRIREIMDVLCDTNGMPRIKIHGLRMLDNKLRCIPFHSADSTNLARNLTDPNMSKIEKGLQLANRIESEQSKLWNTDTDWEWFVANVSKLPEGEK